MIESSSKLLLSQSALDNNLQFIKKHVGPNVKVSSVVKGNAYGHGISNFIPMAMACGINHFSVFSADEAFRVIEAAEGQCQIMIMGDISGQDVSWAIENDVEFFVFEIQRVKEAILSAKKLGKPAKIHLEVETGLNRTGFDELGLQEVIDLIKDNPDQLDVAGICTHFAGAESVANYLRIKKQYKVFNKLLKFLNKQGIEPKVKHTACSAAAMTYPKTCMDMVRIGILQYGFWPSSETFIDYLSKNKSNEKHDPLKRVITWKSRVMSTKKVKRGEFIGYGTSYLAEQDTHVAAVPVGYSHGYSRGLSNLGRALVNNVRVGVIGVVNMNMMMLDITETEAKVGDEVILIGAKNGVEISVASFSELSNQLNYELLTRLPERIPRQVVT